MTRRTNARVAGITFLLYIAIGIASLVVFNGASRGQGIAAKLASLAEHVPEVRAAIVLSLLTCFTALVLVVTLYGLTRDQDPDLAMLVPACRVAEGVLGGVFLVPALGLLWLASGTGGVARNREQRRHWARSSSRYRVGVRFCRHVFRGGQHDFLLPPPVGVPFEPAEPYPPPCLTSLYPFLQSPRTSFSNTIRLAPVIA